jgi:hypothetical protein
VREFILNASFSLHWCFEDEATATSESLLTALQNQEGKGLGSPYLAARTAQRSFRVHLTFLNAVVTGS